MPICPECREEIEDLENLQTGWMCYKLYITEDGQEEYEQKGEFEGDWYVMVWKCPSCSEELFDREEDAIAFLKGDDSTLLETEASKTINRFAFRRK